MEKNQKPDDREPIRGSPRAAASLEVEVEVDVAGDKRRMKLVSKDIGAGGIFLRTNEPASLWKKVKLSVTLPDGGRFEVGGEVVRQITADKATASGQAAGMAIAFDESSRKRHKELLSIVLDLCARQAQEPAPAPIPAPTPAPAFVAAQAPVQTERAAPAKPSAPPSAKPTAQPIAPAAPKKKSTDDLLSEIDDLLATIKPGPSAAAGKPKTSAEPPRSSPSTPPAPGPAKTPAATPTAASTPAPTAGHVDQLKTFVGNYLKTIKGDTYYDALGIPRDASAQQIESAHQQLMAKLQSAGAVRLLPGELSQQVSGIQEKASKAFAILSKPDRKRAYDFLIENKSE